MLSKRYMVSVKNLPAILTKIVDGAPPERFTLEHLSGIGFASSSDRAVIPLLKDLDFLSGDGRPTQRYLDYRDKTRSKRILGSALREAYSDLFLINDNLSRSDRAAIQGKFKSSHGVSDRVAELSTSTFLTLLDNADISSANFSKNESVPEVDVEKLKSKIEGASQSLSQRVGQVDLNYKIEINLPATRDIEIYNAIFKSLRENLIDG